MFHVNEPTSQSTTGFLDRRHFDQPNTPKRATTRESCSREGATGTTSFVLGERGCPGQTVTGKTRLSSGKSAVFQLDGLCGLRDYMGCQQLQISIMFCGFSLFVLSIFVVGRWGLLIV